MLIDFKRFQRWHVWCVNDCSNKNELVLAQVTMWTKEYKFCTC